MIQSIANLLFLIGSLAIAVVVAVTTTMPTALQQRLLFSGGSTTNQPSVNFLDQTQAVTHTTFHTRDPGPGFISPSSFSQISVATSAGPQITMHHMPPRPLPRPSRFESASKLDDEYETDQDPYPDPTSLSAFASSAVSPFQNVEVLQRSVAPISISIGPSMNGERPFLNISFCQPESQFAEPVCTTPCLVLIDTGSSKTAVSRQVFETLNLKPTGRTTLIRFGSGQESRRQITRIQIRASPHGAVGADQETVTELNVSVRDSVNHSLLGSDWIAAVRPQFKYEFQKGLMYQAKC